MSHPFESWTDDDVSDLISAYPLAWIVSGEPNYSATLMPVLPDRDDSGRLVSLTGHFPKSNTHFMQLADHKKALFLFQGASAYVSPELVDRTNWAPTWNYGSARIVAEVEFDEGLTHESLERLVAHMEAGRNEPWTISAMGERYEKIRKGVIGFRAKITSLQARFKLGQDEDPEILHQIMIGMGDQHMSSWMMRFNAHRL